MNTIKFSNDWNSKLSSGKVFTTIRKYDSKKNGYYGERIGKMFNVVLKGKTIGEAKLKDVWGSKFSEVNPPLLMLDTGYTERKDIDKIFKNFKVGPDDRVVVLVFEKISF